MMVLAMSRVALLYRPPPTKAELPERVELVTVTVPLTKLPMPPPHAVAVFPESVELVMVREPRLSMPPPYSPVLFSMVELETVTVAE